MGVGLLRCQQVLEQEDVQFNGRQSGLSTRVIRAQIQADLGEGHVNVIKAKEAILTDQVLLRAQTASLHGFPTVEKKLCPLALVSIRSLHLANSLCLAGAAPGAGYGVCGMREPDILCGGAVAGSPAQWPVLERGRGAVLLQGAQLSRVPQVCSFAQH